MYKLREWVSAWMQLNQGKNPVVAIRSMPRPPSQGHLGDQYATWWFLSRLIRRRQVSECLLLLLHGDSREASRDGRLRNS